MNESRRHNGWKPDRPDPRDRPYSAIREGGLFRSILRPRSHYLHLDNLPPVYNQGQIGSCVGHGVAEACAYALDFVYDRYDSKQPGGLSRLFAYYNAREHKDADEGAYIRSGVKAVAKYGIPDEKHWPYDESKWAVQPSRLAYVYAAPRAKGIEYYRIDNLGDMMDCLLQGFPIVYGMTLYGSFERVKSDGLVPMPGPTEAPIGGHCMLVVGYATHKGCFYVRNSWGPDWGSGGNCWVPFRYMEQYGSDFWAIKRLGR